MNSGVSIPPQILSGFPVDLPNVPPNYSTTPQKPGNIALLLNSNSGYLYHEFSPYTNGYSQNNTSILSGVLSNQQPFIYSYIDNTQNDFWNSLPPAIQSIGTATNITPETVDDSIRVTRFMGSSVGAQFVINQLAIQRIAPFDETRIYNPLSPILATIVPMTLGIGNRPIRHIENGLFGILNSITNTVGINLQNGFTTPSSTVGNSALPLSNFGEGKGLIRGADASKGYAQIQMAWPISNPNVSNNGGLVNALSSMGSAMATAACQLFGTTTITQPKGTLVRADEKTYGFMATSYKLNLKQEWYPSSQTTISSKPSPSGLSNVSSDNISTTSNVSSTTGVLSTLLGPSTGGNNGTLKRTKLIAMPNSQFIQKNINSGISGLSFNARISDGFGRNNQSTNIQTGYSINDGDKYGNDVGKAPDGTLTNSDMMVQYSYYVNDSNNYSTKFSGPDKATLLNTNLQKVIQDFALIPNYQINSKAYSYLLPSGAGGTLPVYVQYDNWTNKQKAFQSQNPGIVGEYQAGNASNPPTLDIYGSKTNNLRMATSFISDGINSLGVMANTIVDGVALKSYPGWKQYGYRPYNDDTIAFFFYDVVNDQYIPFRATVKGISEGNSALWDPLRFIGRADELYSYNGFNRTLSFTFNVVINSVSEILPSWQKINYLASAVKPSNYTQGSNVNQVFNRFIVPPMFMITIGDLYKWQPVIMTSINVNIPDDASWETLNEINSDQWSYLNGIITSNGLGKNYGQLPRECEIAVTCNLLEKERAQAGGNHFGHMPRNNSYTGFITGSNVPWLPTPTILHQNMLVWNDIDNNDEEGREYLTALGNSISTGIKNILNSPTTKAVLLGNSLINGLTSNPSSNNQTDFIPGIGTINYNVQQ